MLLSHFNRELDKTAIIFEFLGKSFRNLEKLFLDRTFPLSPRGDNLGTCGAFDFSEGFLVKIPTAGPQNLVKSDQICAPCMGK